MTRADGSGRVPPDPYDPWLPRTQSLSVCGKPEASKAQAREPAPLGDAAWPRIIHKAPTGAYRRRHR